MKKIFIFLLITSFCNYSISQIIPPHTNTFDSEFDTVGWSHYSINGTDDWEIGNPSAYSFTTAYSLPNAWVTNLNGPYTADSERALETPYYNLMDTTLDLLLSFYHKRNSNGSANYYVEYSEDHGENWEILYHEDAPKKNWQYETGFTGNYYNIFLNSSISLDFIQGQDSIKFRFRYISTIGNQAGWMIDNFAILEESYNVTAVQADSILGINKYFDEFTVESDFIFDNQWFVPYEFHTNFYLSSDLNIDENDFFLGSVSNILSSNWSYWNNTFTLPQGLSAGTYYVIYELDQLNVLEEENENDNSSYAVMVLDTVITPPYSDDFEDSYQSWNRALGNNLTQWSKGDPNGWHIENPRSGENAWFCNEVQSEDPAYLESPYLDLTNSTNSVLCLWYRNYSDNGYNNSIGYKLSSTGNEITTYPNYPYGNSTVIPQSRFYTWDCYCEDISSHDGEKSAKIKLYNTANSNSNILKQSIIDDIYIGEAKPDAAIEGFKTDRFTSSSRTTDTLNYVFFNSGLSILESTTTEFYWSNDTILDETDFLLGTKIETVVTDTSFHWSLFNYSKPTLSDGIYYIIYKIDAANQVDEMREYDNLGYFELFQNSMEDLPYINDFESNINDWRHDATMGNDEWKWTVPQGTIIDSAFSGTKAFMTNDTGIVSSNSRMHLFTPLFDLSQLERPVMEFDLLAHFYNINDYGLWPFSMGNIMFSINGGATWEVLDSTNLSFKRLYYDTEIQTLQGIENLGTSNKGNFLYGKNLPSFRTQNEYQGRDYDDNHHYVVDLSFLQPSTQVQFMYVHSNYNAPMEGMLLDNFEIKEGEIDLLLTTNKKLMVSSTDQRIRQNIKIKNNNNYISGATSVDFYCSIDTTIDSSDMLIGSSNLASLRPYENFLINLDYASPSNYISYNYLLLDIDPQNINEESNASNNQAFLELNMDTSANFHYPILFDFNDDEINGWTWYHDSTGYYHGHRFRHKLIIEDKVNLGQNGEWFLDPIDIGGYSNNFNLYPTHSIESPAFDFSNLSNVKMEFDFICMGKNDNSYPGNAGGNLEYSIDGGLNWIVLSDAQDPLAENWYNLSSVQSLSGTPGWGEWPEWSTAVYDLSFLVQNPSVRFRFNFKSVRMYNIYAIHGFRLDNFKISASKFTILSDIDICNGESVLIFNNYENTSGIYYDTLTCSNGCDSILAQKINIITIDPSVSINGSVVSCNFEEGSYQWLYCDSNYTSITGATSQNFTAIYNGSYALELSSNGCKDTSECYQIIGTNIISNELNHKLKVYPNPSKGNYTIDFGETFSKVKITISNLNGKQIQANTYTKKQIIDFKINEPVGIYILNIESDNKNVKVHLVKK